MISPWLTGFTLATAALLMFASNILITKAAADRVSLNLGFLISVSVNLIFCSLLFAIELVTRKTTLQLNITAIGIFILAGAFSTYLGRWFFFESVIRLGASKASIFQVSSPAFTAILAWIFLAESLALPSIIGIIVTILGLGVVAYKPTVHVANPQTRVQGPSKKRTLSIMDILRADILLGIGSSLAYAVGTLLRGRGIRTWNEPILGALLGAAAGLLLYVCTGAKLRELAATLKVSNRQGLLLYAVSGVLTISAQICAIWSFRFIPISVSNLVTLCTPLVVIPVTYLFFKNSEAITLKVLIGALLAISGIAVTIMSAK